MPITNGLLFGYLNTKSTLIWYGLGYYFLNYFAIDFVQSIKPYIITKIALLHRVIRTKKLLDKKVLPEVTNTAQRIQEDIKLSYVNRITVWSEYLISGLILIQLFTMNLHFPILLASAVLYSIISICIAIRFNPKLTYAEKEVQSTEADFRSSLTFTNLFKANDMVKKAARIQSEYFLFTKVQSAIMQILPFIILIPLYMSGAIDLGVVMKHQATFALIVTNAAVLINLYTIYIKGGASEHRVKELEE